MSSGTPLSTAGVSSAISGLAESAKQTASSTKERAAEMAETMQYRAWRAWSWSMHTIRKYVAKYPPLGALLVSFLATASVPVGIFTLFAIFTLGTLLAIALTVVGGVEGALLLGGGTLLMFALAASGVISLLVGGGIGIAWMTYCTARRVWRMASGATTTAAGGAEYERPYYGRSAMEELRKTGEELKRSVTSPVTSLAGK